VFVIQYNTFSQQPKYGHENALHKTLCNTMTSINWQSLTIITNQKLWSENI